MVDLRHMELFLEILILLKNLPVQKVPFLLCIPIVCVSGFFKNYFCRSFYCEGQRGPAQLYDNDYEPSLAKLIDKINPDLTNHFIIQLRKVELKSELCTVKIHMLLKCLSIMFFPWW